MQESLFAQRLRLVIEQDPSLTEAGLAVKAGLDNSTIRQLLAGKTKSPRLDTAMKICAALGTTVEEFMGVPLTPEAREINRLVSALPADLLRQFLGYGQGLVAGQDQVQTKPQEVD